MARLLFLGERLPAITPTRGRGVRIPAGCSPFAMSAEAIDFSDVK
jgi:hypothetical protein